MSEHQLAPETMVLMNDTANSIVESLKQMDDLPQAMTTLGMACAKMIFSCTKDRADFDEVCRLFANQIQNMINAEEADGNICWEKAD